MDGGDTDGDTVGRVQSATRSFLVACAGALVVGVTAGAVTFGDVVTVTYEADVLRSVVAAPTPARNEAVHYGVGAWVDVFDYAPEYQQEGAAPAVDPSAVEEMAEAGVRTLYLQAARSDNIDGSVVAPRHVAEFLVRAHRHRMRVVAWYLPQFSDVDADLSRLRALADFEVGGHGFDGIAVDIEATGAVPDAAVRSERLVELSERLRDELPGQALGAITLTPVHLEVVNPEFWPGFPWDRIADEYDVWLPMAYWTDRTEASGYRDPQRYVEESVRLLRDRIGDENGAVHPVGGIAADGVDQDDLDAFAGVLDDVDAVGGSIYDWASLGPTLRPEMDALVPTS